MIRTELKLYDNKFTDVKIRSRSSSSYDASLIYVKGAQIKATNNIFRLIGLIDANKFNSNGEWEKATNSDTTEGG